MAKSKTYTYEGEGDVTIAIPGTASTITLSEGDTYEAETDAEQEALDANPDVTSGKPGRSKDDDTDDKRKDQ